MILVTAKLHAAPEKRLELGQFLQGILSEIRKEKGCREASASQSLEDKNILMLLLRWVSAESFSAFRHSNKFKALLGSKILLQDKQEIEFETVDDSAEE